MGLKTLLLVGASLVSGCAYHMPAEPTPIGVVPSTAPASIRLGISSMTASTYSITATVLTRDGHFVPGVLVTFAMDSGSVSPTEATTNGNGVAQAVATASTTSATLTVSGGSLTSTTTITGTLATGIPPTIPPTPTPTPTPSPTTPVGPLGVTLTTAADVIIGTQTMFAVSVTNGPVRSLVWAFGDGVTFAGSSPSTAHTYAAVGSYPASVTVTDTLGRSASASTTATVNAAPPPPSTPPAPVATLSAVMSCTLALHGNPTSCNLAASYGGSTIPSTAITRADWDFGDGQSQTVTGIGASALIQHTYVQAGTYLIVATLNATTTDGSKTTAASRSVVIQ